MTDKAHARACLAECCRAAYLQKLVGGTGGNMSVRVGDEIYITATGCRLGDVSPETLSVVLMDGTLKEGEPPSKEILLHLGIYRARPDVFAVVHLHPVNSIAASILAPDPDAAGGSEPMPAYSSGYRVKIPSCALVANFEPGSPELAAALVQASLRSNVILMRNHGITTMAKDIKAALSLAEEAEQNAWLHVILKGQGALS